MTRATFLDARKMKEYEKQSKKEQVNFQDVLSVSF